MAGALTRSAMGLGRMLGSRALPARGVSSAAKVVALIGKMKEKGVSSMKKEFVHETVRSINLARENKIYGRIKGVALASLLVSSGFVIGSTVVTAKQELL